ncbi:hypothetical protein NDA01_21020 [Trichocoleus desertorum AS-A10]|uniref:hypothetical protein n=1 Tax=Trichocoleus desertorum TaxID=1481672 RepID=UPI00329A7F23
MNWHIPLDSCRRSILQKISDRQFHQLVMANMAIAGGLMLWEQRDLMTFWQAIH